MSPPVQPLPNVPPYWRGHFLQSQEEGVLYPVVHFADHHGEELMQNPLHNSDGSSYQGLYKEVRAIRPPAELPLPKSDQSTSYILLGFKSLDKSFCQVMLDTWRDWTGARYIYMYLPDELGLSRISLFQRISPSDPSLFAYVVLAECRSVNTVQQQMQMLDFVQRLRVERVTGYVSMYSNNTPADSRTSDIAPPVPVRTLFSLNGPSKYGRLYRAEATH